MASLGRPSCGEGLGGEVIALGVTPFGVPTSVSVAL